TSEGVDISAARTVPGATNRVAVILVDAGTGDRTVLWHHDPAMHMSSLDDASREAAVSGRLLLVDCEDITASTAAATAARQAAIPTIVDIDDVQAGTP